jgi:exoribonuclease R
VTLDEARAHVGDAVTYQAHHGAQVEQGVVTSVNDSYVFVRFGANPTSAACRPDHLQPLRRTT